LFVTAEELGLFGSEFFMRERTIPAEKIFANLNIDMIGRVDKLHQNEPEYIYLIGSDRISQDLHEVSEKTNEEWSNYKLDYRYNEKNDPNRFYYRSDHYNFAREGVPVIFYFSGIHEDYHEPSDTSEKLDYQRMESIGRLIYYTSYNLANREEVLKKTKGL
jgi:Zn-dependent M28 family amino/carboxypeptidase